MATEPITIYARRGDPARIAALLRSLQPRLRQVGSDEAWERLELITPERLGQPARLLQFTYDPASLAEPNGSRQKAGMRRYLERFPDTPFKTATLDEIPHPTFTLGTVAEPGIDLDDPEDDRGRWIRLVAQNLDGLIFTPSSVRDANGRVLIHAEGRFDPLARLSEPPPSDPPSRPLNEASASSEALPISIGSAPDDLDDDETQPGNDGVPIDPPSPRRVARRTLALAALTGRALLEQRDLADPMTQVHWERLMAWVTKLELLDEFEADEWAVVSAPPGQLNPTTTVNATWRIEGLTILAWVLERSELPEYDQLIVPDDLMPAVGFLDVEEARGLIEHARLRAVDQIDKTQRFYFTLNWRLRQFRFVDRQPLDFAQFAAECWFGTMELDGARLINGDLELSGLPLAAADEETLSTIHSVIQERHHALNWVLNGPALYSATDTST